MQGQLLVVVMRENFIAIASKATSTPARTSVLDQPAERFELGDVRAILIPAQARMICDCRQACIADERPMSIVLRHRSHRVVRHKLRRCQMSSNVTDWLLSEL